MRRYAFAVLAVATGCNEIFGLKPTIQLDAPSDAQAIRTTLRWAIATTDGVPLNGVDPVVTLAPIGSEPLRPGMPMIQVGDATSLSEAAYHADDEGSFEIPYALRDAPHRIVFTLPGESVAHEYQWAISGAHLTVPRTTRLDVPPVPANSGYTIMPTGLAGTPTFPAIATSGSFTFALGASEFQNTTGTFNFQYAAKAKALAGPLGAPQMGNGDWVLVMNWAGRSGSQSSVAGWALAQVDLAANMMTSPATAPQWQTGDITYSTQCLPDVTYCFPSFNASPTKARLDGALGTRATGTTAYRMMYGISPSLDLPGFVAGSAPTYVEKPLIIPFADSTTLDPTVIVGDPAPSLPFPRVVYAGLSDTRTVNGVALTSSLQTLSNTFMGPIAYPAPLVRTFELGGVSLSGDTDDVAVQVGSSARELELVAESGQTADDYVVTLYELAGTTLAPIRVYHVLAGLVAVDGNLLVTGKTYVFGATARHGLPGASAGDFRSASFPFGVATTFSRTFKVQ